MRTLYKYIYCFNPDFIEEHNGSAFAIEEYQILEDHDYHSKEELTGFEKDYYFFGKDYYFFVGKDDGVMKSIIDNWKELDYYDGSMPGWSFTKSEEKMKEFQNIARSWETKNLFKSIENANKIKERLEKIFKATH